MANNIDMEIWQDNTQIVNVSVETGVTPPTLPTLDGVYALKCVVVNGVATLAWVTE